MKRTSATCQTCNTLHVDLPFEVDETGGFAVLEVAACADPDCGAMLCGACSKFACDSCGETHCTEHRQTVDGLKCCKACALEIAAQESEPALCCPECLGSELSAVGTGNWEEFECRSCGHTGEAGELVPETAVIAAVARKQPARETRDTAVPEVA